MRWVGGLVEGGWMWGGWLLGGWVHVRVGGHEVGGWT